MRATSPAGDASYEGVVQWTGDLGNGVRAPEAGQSDNRDDAATGSKQLRRAFFKHLQTRRRQRRPGRHAGQDERSSCQAASVAQALSEEQPVIAVTYGLASIIIFITAALLILVARSASSP